MATGARLLTADELLHLPDDELRHELVEGRLTTMSPTGLVHGILAGQLAAALTAHVNERRLGLVTVETGFTLKSRPDTVRAPDVSFISRARVPPGNLSAKFWDGAPDLAVEVLSPDDRPHEVENKTREYLEAGAAAVWIVRPDARTVTIHHASGDPVVFGEGDVLEDPAALPGFRLSISELFEQMRQP